MYVKVLRNFYTVVNEKSLFKINESKIHTFNFPTFIFCPMFCNTFLNCTYTARACSQLHNDVLYVFLGLSRAELFKFE